MSTCRLCKFCVKTTFLHTFMTKIRQIEEFLNGQNSTYYWNL